MSASENKTDKEWREQLTPEQYYVLRQAGTEPPFRNEYWNLHDDGIYYCAGCGTELFKSQQKFDSHCGWPSFWDSMDREKLRFIKDDSHGMHRTEVRCAACDGHLGHLFDDGPLPSGERYCINSLSLKFKSDTKA